MKCKFSGSQRASVDKVTLQNQELQNSKHFKYLGSIVSKDGEIREDAKHRVQVGWVKWVECFRSVVQPQDTLKVDGNLYHMAKTNNVLWHSVGLLRNKHAGKIIR